MKECFKKSDMGKILSVKDLNQNPNPRPKNGFKSNPKSTSEKRILNPNPKSSQKDFEILLKYIQNPQFVIGA